RRGGCRRSWFVWRRGKRRSGKEKKPLPDRHIPTPPRSVSDIFALFSVLPAAPPVFPENQPHLPSSRSPPGNRRCSIPSRCPCPHGGGRPSWEGAPPPPATGLASRGRHPGRTAV